jgi:hypothetical protein
MVCVTSADGPKLQLEQPVLHLEIRTVRGHPADSSTHVDSPTTPGGQSGKPTPTKNAQLDGSKQSDARTHEEHDEQLAGRQLAYSLPTPRGRSTRNRNNNPNLKPRARAHLSIHGSPKRLELLRKDLGEM